MFSASLAYLCNRRHRSRSRRHRGARNDSDRSEASSHCPSDVDLPSHALDGEIAGLPSITAHINFGASTHPTEVAEQREAVPVVIYDGRADPQRFNLEEHGFQLVSSPTLGVNADDGTAFDFYDEQVAVRSFFPQAEQLVLSHFPGAVRAIAFDHILRNPKRLAEELADAGSQGTGQSIPKTKFLQATLANAHGDYTARSGFTRARQLLQPFVEPAEIEAALANRFAIVNVWYPLETVRSDPLALCTWRSASPQDVLTNRLHFPHRVGETYKVKYSSRQHWVYFSEATPKEAIMLKTFDSSSESSRFTFHSAFQLPEQERGAELPVRASTEVRVLVFFGAGLENLATDFVPPHVAPSSTSAAEIVSGVARRETIDFGNEW